MSDYSGSPSDHQLDFQPPKRKATQAGLDGHPAGRSVKRRASKACQCCRARKVRCNVTEHGAPCTNCRLDEVDCIVSESRRKKLVSLPSAPSDTFLRANPTSFQTTNRGFVPLQMSSCHAAVVSILLAQPIAAFPSVYTNPSHESRCTETTCNGTWLTWPGNGAKMTSNIPSAPPPHRLPLASWLRATPSTAFKL
jgi:hypothetical protein